MTPERKPFQPLTSKGVCAIYELLYSRGFVSFPVTKEAIHKIEAIVANINSIYFGINRYPNNEEKAVAYLYFIAKGHAFTDGNKRTAVLSFAVVCQFNELLPDPNINLDELVVFIEKSKGEDPSNFIRIVSTVLFGSGFLENE